MKNLIALSQLPERFKTTNHRPEFNSYVNRKYSKLGYKKNRAIEYNPEFQPTYTHDRYRWVENVSDGLRKVGDAADIVKLNHTGWYVDNFQDETVHGEVYQLPTHNGELLFIPAVNDPWNPDCACLSFSSITDNKEDAAHWSDAMAKLWAEDARENQAKEDAALRIEDITAEITNTYKSFRQIARDIRANCTALQGIDVVRQLVHKEWLRTKDTIHTLRAERQRIERNGIQY